MKQGQKVIVKIADRSAWNPTAATALDGNRGSIKEIVATIARALVSFDTPVPSFRFYGSDVSLHWFDSDVSSYWFDLGELVLDPKHRRYRLIDERDGNDPLGGPISGANAYIAAYATPTKGQKHPRDLAIGEASICEYRIRNAARVYSVRRLNDEAVS